MKGLGEILAGQREEVNGPQDEIDAIMGKANDKLAAMNRLAKKQNKLAQRKIADSSDDGEDDEELSQAKSKTLTKKTRKGGDDGNLPNPDDLMNMLMAQNGGGRGAPQGLMMPPGGMPGMMPGGMMPGMAPGMMPGMPLLGMPGTSMGGSRI